MSEQFIDVMVGMGLSRRAVLQLIAGACGAAALGIQAGGGRVALAQGEKPTDMADSQVLRAATGSTGASSFIFTPLQGGVPIMIDGQIIGGVGVSGAMSAAQDEELAIAGAASLTDQKPLPVSFFDSKTVTDAFSKGSVLEDGSNGENYMVHASRREKSGMSEVHTLDTDIIYVVEGTATFVTGGRSIDPKMTAANEFRGTSIEGGETRQLKKGDVVIVPNGTPHWFKQVDGAFLYYVVKVR